tara:strand:+ start:9936 stop:11441 length:1506 start_codon:yes stop_codon:yes gene_type:complete
MGADRTLVAAAGKMAPPKVDYTNLFQGISAIGTLIATKTNMANEILAEMPEGIDVSELPEEMRNSKTNMDFFETTKKQYTDAVKAMKFSAPFTKKYRNAVATINKIKSGYEKIKQDLVGYAEYRTKIFTEHTTQSKQANAEQKNYYADMVIQGGEMNAQVEFTLDGLKFGSKKLGLGDLPEIYSSSVGIKAGKMARDIILNFGKNVKLKNGQYVESEVRDAANNLIDTLHADGGYRAVKSLAFDAKFDGRSFMQHYGDKLMLGEDDMKGEYSGLSVNQALEKWKANNPNKSAADIQAMQDNMMADAWDIDQNELLTNELVDFIVRETEKKYNGTEYVSPYDQQTRDTYFVNGQYVPKINIDSTVALLNSNQDYPTSSAWDGSSHKRVDGKYYHMPKNSDEYTEVSKDQLAANIGIAGSAGDGPNIYGYERANVPKKTKNLNIKLEQGSYGKIEGNDGNIITGQITITGVNSDGTYDITDSRGIAHRRIQLPNTIKPPVVKK